MMHRHISKLVALVVFNGLTMAVCVARAEEQPVEFLHAMQKNGLGETAQEYLSLLQKNGLPPALKETLDLELSNCLRAAAGEAITPEESKKRLAKAQEHLDKFLKEYPKHPEVAGALQAAGNFEFQRGLELLSSAKGNGEKNEQDRLAEESRKAFAAARTRLKEAATFFEKQMNDIELDISKNPLKAAPAAARGRGRSSSSSAKDPRIRQLENAIFNWLESQGTLGFLEFQVGQTYFDIKNPERKKVLQTAAKEFYKVKEYSQKKGIGNLPPIMLAKLWEGRTQLELGNVDVAIDIFEECVGDEPTGKIAAKGELPFNVSYAAQVKLAIVLAIYQKKGAEPSFNDGKVWRDAHKDGRETSGWSRVPGYQGITLQMAKCKIEMGEKEPDKKKALANFKEALGLLQEMSKFPSEYTAEALRLKATVAVKVGGEGAKGGELDPTTFADALALARDEAQQRHWPQAISYYEKAVKLSEKEKDQELVAKAKQEYALARMFLLEQSYTAAAAANDPAKVTEVMTKASALSASLDRTSPIAANSASLAVGCAVWLYNRIKTDKTKEPEAGDNVLKSAQTVIDNWPNSSGGGKCAMYIASINISRNKFDAAAKTLENVAESSPVYGDAMQLAAKLHWQQYATERNKPVAERNEAALKLHRDAVIRNVDAGVKGLEAQPETKELDQQVTELRLIETKAYLDSGAPADLPKALAAIKPLADKIKTGQALDKTSLDIAVMAVRVYVKTDKFDEAAKIGQLLLAVGTDDSSTNTTLVVFVTQVNEEVKKARTACSEAQLNPDPKVLELALAKQARNIDLLKELLAKLSGRSNLNESQQLYLADLCSEVGLLAEASRLYDNVLGVIIAAEGEKGKKSIAVRAKLVGLQRQQKKFDEAYKNISELLKVAQALEPLMEKGRILQAWAEEDMKTAGSAKRFEPAGNYWGNTANSLGNMKPRVPPEYYEANYNWAYCLLQRTKVLRGDAAKELAKEGSTILNNTLVRTPALSGPEMVAKYKALIADCDKAAGITPAPK